MTKKELLKMNSHKLVSLWNEYCEAVNYDTDVIYDNDEEAFETYGFTIRGTMQNNKAGVYDWDHEFICSDGYGNPVSSNDPLELIDVDALHDWLLQKQHEA
jgi:hypothetical protein